MKPRYSLVPPAEPPAIRPANGLGTKLVALYGSADPRSLGLFRIALGALLALDVLLKLPDVPAHFSNSGWLSNHFALFRPMSEHLFSVYFAFGTPHEVELMLGLHLLVCLLLLVGYRTKLMQILALVLTTSLNSRNVMLENGGSVVLDILTVWSVFLPLGRRFSIDALRASWRERKETSEAALNDRLDPPRDTSPVASLAVTALLLQWAVIYGFNAVQKNGAPWRDGTAVYYFLQQDRLVTWLGAWLRDVLPLGLVKLLTFATLFIEGVIPLLLLSPWRSPKARLLAFGLALPLHLGIDCALQLGSFSWAMLVAFLVFVPPEAWTYAARRLRARRTACVVHFDPQRGASLALSRWIKRCDALGLVTFRALDEASPKKAQRSLCVSVEGQRSVAGWEALLAASRALWLGAWPLRLVAPLVRKRIERRLSQLATQPAELDLDWGLEHLPAQADAHAPPASEARLAFRKLVATSRDALVAMLLVICGSQLLIENPIVPEALKPRARPRLFDAVIGYPRIYQGWSMFAPAPPTSDGRLVIDGRTKDGRHFDPLTGQAPVFELHPAGTPRSNLLWGYFHTRIAEERFRPYWGGVRDLLMNHHKLSGRPEDELVSFEAHYVTQSFSPPGAVRPPPERRLLFSSTSIPTDAPAPRPKGKPSKAGPRRAQ